MTGTKRTLFQISDDLATLDILLNEMNGEIADEQTEAAIDQFFAELGEERDAKLNGYCSLIKHFEYLQTARETEASRIAALAQTDANKAKQLKSRLLLFLQLHDLKNIETERFKIARQANGGKTPVFLSDHAIQHPEELPEKYRKVTFSPMLDRIREDLERLTVENDTDLQKDLDGLATLGERGEHIRIR